MLPKKKEEKDYHAIQTVILSEIDVKIKYSYYLFIFETIEHFLVTIFYVNTINI